MAFHAGSSHQSVQFGSRSSYAESIEIAVVSRSTLMNLQLRCFPFSELNKFLGVSAESAATFFKFLSHRRLSSGEAS